MYRVSKKDSIFFQKKINLRPLIGDNKFWWKKLLSFFLTPCIKNNVNKAKHYTVQDLMAYQQHRVLYLQMKLWSCCLSVWWPWQYRPHCSQSWAHEESAWPLSPSRAL